VSVKVLKSPTNRLRLEVTGPAPLEQNDIDWLKFLGQKPQHITAGESPAAGGQADGE